MINYETKAAAMRLIQKIEGSIDPFDVATGNSSVLLDEIEQMIYSMGGHSNPREMQPGGVAIYLVALMLANS